MMDVNVVSGNVIHLDISSQNQAPSDFRSPTLEDPPVPETPFFTRDHYDKYSLAPNIQELWEMSQRKSPLDVGNAVTPCDGGDAEINGQQPTEDSLKLTNNCNTSEEKEKGLSNCESEDQMSSSAETPKNNKQFKQKGKTAQSKVVEQIDFPEPRLPYPTMSRLTIQDQKTYVYIMNSKKPKEPPPHLKEQVNNEVAEFMHYLHNVYKLCPQDYNCISQGALKYSEDFFMAYIENLAYLPNLYQICEMTSLTGGIFDQGLALTFEKQLLIMGSVDIGDHEIVAADAQLATDYQSVSSQNPPAKKARDIFAPISSDCNAEKLSQHYEPNVCLTEEALVTLLDNHGPEFGTPWELPVWIKVHPEKAPQRKTVYIDPPLLKTEVTVGERSLLFHEESLKISLNNHGKKNIPLVATERLAAENPSPLLEHTKRSLAESESRGLDFSDVELTDLETFGDTPAVQRKRQKTAATPKVTRSGRGHACEKTAASSQEDEEGEATEEETTLATDTEDAVKENQLSPEAPAYSVDSEDEKLVIDDPSSPAGPGTTGGTDRSPTTSTPAPRRATRQRRSATKMAAVPGDQLGEILRMQSVLLKPNAKDVSKCPPAQPATPACFSPPPPSLARGHPTSLVKPCVTSYLENQKQDGEEGSAAGVQRTSSTSEHKKLLPEHLQGSTEDERDYQAPEEGNLLYKLYSLNNLLLLVRSSLALTYSRAGRNGINRYVPVHVLPKLEYQLTYGAECLSSSQACRLWAKAMLHSSTVSYIAHISAHTSKLALLRQLPEDWKQKLSCDFRPSKSLNILQHMLKKLTGLEEGRYLIRHKAGEPFVTIFKAGPSEKVTRGTYDLRQAHGSPPKPGPGPWLPVDPSVLLPFHRSNWRVPCTFPPREPPTQPRKGNCKPGQAANSRTRKAGQNTGQNAGQNPAKPSNASKKNKKKRQKQKKKANMKTT